MNKTMNSTNKGPNFKIKNRPSLEGLENTNMKFSSLGKTLKNQNLFWNDWKTTFSIKSFDQFKQLWSSSILCFKHNFFLHLLHVYSFCAYSLVLHFWTPHLFTSFSIYIPEQSIASWIERFSSKDKCLLTARTWLHKGHTYTYFFSFRCSGQECDYIEAWSAQKNLWQYLQFTGNQSFCLQVLIEQCFPTPWSYIIYNRWIN